MKEVVLKFLRRMKNMKILLKGNSSVTIDGRTFRGNNVSISGDKVVVDGVVQGGSLVGPVTVTVNGDVSELNNSSGDVYVNGSVNNVKTTSGDVNSLDVNGGVSTTSGDVTCGKVNGNVSTVSGDVITGRGR